MFVSIVKVYWNAFNNICNRCNKQATFYVVEKYWQDMVTVKAMVK